LIFAYIRTGYIRKNSSGIQEKHCKFDLSVVSWERKGEMGMLQLNTVGLYKVMQDFYTLTGLRIVIFDAAFNELMAYPRERERFCHLLRQTPEGEANCSASDREGCISCAGSKEPVVYRCHAGLTEAVVPILDKETVLAYVMFGQLIPKETCREARQRIKARNPELAGEVDGIPVKTQREISAAATVLQAITAYVMTNHWVVPNKAGFIREIDRYIEAHLAESMTAEDISAAFGIGRTRLYELSSAYLGCGLAAYIRAQRIRHAQAMLERTDMSVTDIAFATGFSDYNHFSRIFKQITGVSAREYRKNR